MSKFEFPKALKSHEKFRLNDLDGSEKTLLMTAQARGVRDLSLGRGPVLLNGIAFHREALP